MCTVHCIVHLQYTFCLSVSLSLACMKVRESEVLAWVRGKRKMSQVLGEFGLLNFIVLGPVLAWRAF
jgi:hypothetical protein